MKKLIAISLSPNTFEEDVLLSIRLLFSPFSYKRGNAIKSLEEWFCNYFKASHAISFASGRTGLLAILQACEIGKGDEVLLQAFTCVAVPNSVIWCGAKPIYVDINNSLTISIKDLENKITKKTKAIIVQHTFGIPSEMDKILKVARKHNLFIIEDCAHGIGEKYRDKKLGTFGDAAFFSFGRDKAFSSVFGGMVITNNDILTKKIRDYQNTLKFPSSFWVIQQLFHPIAFSFILPVYKIGLGKLTLVILQKLQLLSFPVSYEEKTAGVRVDILKKFPNALCELALFQLKRIDEFNKRRKEISSFYVQNLKELNVSLPVKKPFTMLRFPILSDRKDELLSKFKKNQIYLGNWYSSTIDPKGVNFDNIFYVKSSCPKAEQVAKKIINLPTYPRMEIAYAKKIVDLLSKYA